MSRQLAFFAVAIAALAVRVSAQPFQPEYNPALARAGEAELGAVRHGGRAGLAVEPRATLHQRRVLRPYLNVEHIDEQFLKSRFGADGGNLYKSLWPADPRERLAPGVYLLCAVTAESTVSLLVVRVQ